MCLEMPRFRDTYGVKTDILFCIFFLIIFFPPKLGNPPGLYE